MGIWECMCSAEWAAAQTICAFWMIFAGACNFLLWHRWAFALVSWWAIAVMICLYVYHGILISIQHSTAECCVVYWVAVAHMYVYMCARMLQRCLGCDDIHLYMYAHVCDAVHVCQARVLVVMIYNYTCVHIYCSSVLIVMIYNTHVCMYARPESWLWWYMQEGRIMWSLTLPVLPARPLGSSSQNK